ncbi:MAG: HlyD family efflux transporter periplasmic adaptor subunit [Pirellulaceae bacterium]|nr:HlyD family efflux transporter periplasmic adaptor subunit [Pirellulaceae bacterium]MDP6553614.1 HlyD family efflux transporter periplasmic adaptor subunit [Pirellulaceae bacterium]
MRSEIWRHIISGLISVTILAIGFAGLYFVVYKPTAPAAEPTAAPPPFVKTIPLERHTGKLPISAEGTVVPFREISTSAEVVGRVIFKDEQCNAGNFVTKGTVLIRIDPRDYEFEIQRLTHQLKEASASIEELAVEIENTVALITLSKEDLVLQQRELGRISSLTAGVVTESDLDRAKQVELAARNALTVLKNQEHLQRTQLNRADASRKLVETQMEKAELDLKRTEVVAATDGVVVEDFAEEGDYVQKGAPLLTLEDTSAVEVKCSLQMDELYWLWRSQSQHNAAPRQAARPYEIPQTRVKVFYELPQSHIRYRWSGHLSRFDGIGLDEKTRTVPCRVLVDAPLDVVLDLDDDEPIDVTTTVRGETPPIGPPALVRGMYVVVEIQVAAEGDLVQIPERLVRPGKALWVARNKQLRVIKPLRLIELVENPHDKKEEPYWIADATASNLAPGDAVIVTPLTAVTDAMAIRLEATP